MSTEGPNGFTVLFDSQEDTGGMPYASQEGEIIHCQLRRHDAFDENRVAVYAHLRLGKTVVGRPLPFL